MKASLEKRLIDELVRSGDPRLMDDGKFFETPPMSGPLQDEKAFWDKSEGKGKAKAKKKAK